jgi:hypothetical protein
MPDREHTMCLLLDWTSHHGGIWREMSEADANEAAIVQRIIDGLFSHPMKIVAFNTAKEWSRDVTQEIALRLLTLNQEGVALGAAAREFVERVTGQSATAIV